MRRVGYIGMSALLLLASVVLVLAGLGVQNGRAVQLRLGPVALTPETAVRAMLNNRGPIADVQVVDKQPTRLGMLVVYHYLRHGADQPRREFGYALVTMRLGGWSVASANIEQAAPSEEVSYATTPIGTDLLVYGYARNPAITAVDVAPAQGAAITREVTRAGFSLLLPTTERLRELRTLAPAPHPGGRYTQPAVVHLQDEAVR